MKKIVVIGGSAAGAKAAAKARRLDEFASITIIQKDPDLSMAACGYPYYVGGHFDNRNMLLATPTGVVRDPVFFKKAKGIEALVETEVSSIDRTNKKVVCKNYRTREEQTLPYDKLIIATGARPTLPPLANIDLQGITTLLTMGDTDYLKKICEDKKVKKTVAQENSGKLVSLVRKEAGKLAEENNSDLLLTDGPPGIGCPVIASMSGATAIILVVEPTVSGVHDMQRVAELAAHFKRPCMLCVNKYDLNLSLTEEMETMARSMGITLVGRIPFDTIFVKSMVKGQTVLEYDINSPVSEIIKTTWKKITEVQVENFQI